MAPTTTPAGPQDYMNVKIDITSMNVRLSQEEVSEVSLHHAVRPGDEKEDGEDREYSNDNIETCTKRFHCPFHSPKTRIEQHEHIVSGPMPMARFLSEPTHEHGLAFIRPISIAFSMYENHMEVEAREGGEGQRDIEVYEQLEINLDLEAKLEMGGQNDETEKEEE